MYQFSTRRQHFKTQRGVLENDTIIITFNTSTNVKNHETKVVEAVSVLQNKVESLVEKWNSSVESNFFASR